MRALFWILIAGPLLILVAILALANNDVVTLSLDPVSATPAFALTMPLYVLFFAALFAGILLGGIAVWIRQGVNRGMLRSERRRAETLEGENRRLRAEIDDIRRPRPQPAETAALPAPGVRSAA